MVNEISMKTDSIINNAKLIVTVLSIFTAFITYYSKFNEYKYMLYGVKGVNVGKQMRKMTSNRSYSYILPLLPAFSLGIVWSENDYLYMYSLTIVLGAIIIWWIYNFKLMTAMNFKASQKQDKKKWYFIENSRLPIYLCSFAMLCSFQIFMFRHYEGYGFINLDNAQKMEMIFLYFGVILINFIFIGYTEGCLEIRYPKSHYFVVHYDNGDRKLICRELYKTKEYYILMTHVANQSKKERDSRVNDTKTVEQHVNRLHKIVKIKVDTVNDIEYIEDQLESVRVTIEERN